MVELTNRERFCFDMGNLIMALWMDGVKDDQIIFKSVSLWIQQKHQDWGLSVDECVDIVKQIYESVSNKPSGEKLPYG